MATSIRIRGQVQGVGFRPFVWHLATRLGITGRVWNDAEGVVVHAWGDKRSLVAFQRDMRSQLPPLARIDSIESTHLDAGAIPADFVIEASHSDGKSAAAITPDAATCPHCLSDIHDPAARHHGYAFTSCTHCGPRLSVVRAVPYDRPNTSMVAFPMCEACRTEYDDPSHRRFHAQTHACPECGPQLWLEDAAGHRLPATSANSIIEQTTDLLREGRIIAIKGIGGVHLAVDAGNDTAVSRLRARKQRYDKPFALMAKDIACIHRFAEVSADETQLLNSTAAPIVLLARRRDGEALPASLAPGQSRLGFMLPYSPLHTLLMQHLDRPLVLTSGNRSDEPQCISNRAARSQLSDIADFFLLHDRDIVNRLDDSVAIVSAGHSRLVRRARGYAPAPVQLHDSFAAAPRVLAMGAELKSTFCQLSGGQAIVSQHLGDLEHAATHADYRQALSLYQTMFGFSPEAIAADMHPDYFATRLGQEIAGASSLPLIAVQHHHAHIAAVMAEHRLPVDTSPVLGIALDGLGFGADGSLWGGEFLLADYLGFERLACFQSLPMPGGTQAIHEPWRNTFAHLNAIGWEGIQRDFGDTDIVEFLTGKPLSVLQGMIEKGLNSPLSSSCGRLFDAVAAALGICRTRVGYEGQAAIELECLAQASCSDAAPYPCSFVIDENSLTQIQWQPMWLALLDDLKHHHDAAVIAARFHRSIASAVCEMTAQICHRHAIQSVVLCGGSFQNSFLLETVANHLGSTGLRVLIAQHMPLNDGGLALGQASIAAARLLKESSHD